MGDKRQLEIINNAEWEIRDNGKWQTGIGTNEQWEMTDNGERQLMGMADDNDRVRDNWKLSG